MLSFKFLAFSYQKKILGEFYPHQKKRVNTRSKYQGGNKINDCCLSHRSSQNYLGKTNTKVIDEQIVKNANTQCFLPKYVLARCTSKFTSMLLCNTNALKRF